MAEESRQVISEHGGGTPEVVADPAKAPSAAEIRSQIERTRQDMTQTIDAIQARLSPGRLMTDAKQSVAEATARRFQRIKEHPIPYAVAGVAMVALVALMRRRRVRAWRRASRKHYLATMANIRARRR